MLTQPGASLSSRLLNPAKAIAKPDHVCAQARGLTGEISGRRVPRIAASKSSTSKCVLALYQPVGVDLGDRQNASTTSPSARPRLASVVSFEP